MPVSYQTDAKRKIVVITAVGVVTAADAIGCLNALVTDTTVPIDMPWLVDGREVGRAPSPGEIRTIAGVLRQQRIEGTATSRIAIIAGSDLIYGIARMFGGHARLEPAEFDVFRDERVAVSWLAASS
jgi:hypothetical protein